MNLKRFIIIHNILELWIRKAVNYRYGNVKDRSNILKASESGQTKKWLNCLGKSDPDGGCEGPKESTLSSSRARPRLRWLGGRCGGGWALYGWRTAARVREGLENCVGWDSGVRISSLSTTRISNFNQEKKSYSYTQSTSNFEIFKLKTHKHKSARFHYFLLKR